MSMMQCYLVEVGVLLTKEDKEFECYNHVYDKKHGYFDEGQHYVKNLEDAKKEVLDYVTDGVERTYGIISNTVMPEDIDLEEACVEDESYLVDSIVFSAVKEDGQVKENFVKKERK